MIGHVELEDWLAPHQLEAAGISRTREEFMTNPFRAVRLQPFLVDAAARSLSRFLTAEARYDHEFELKRRGTVSEEEWLKAPPEERFYSIAMFKGPDARYENGENHRRYEDFRTFLSGRPLLDHLEAITGFSLERASMTPRILSAGESIAAHIDDDAGRCLAFAFYLSPGWRPEFGGALEFVDPRKGTVRFEAEFNSIVVFDATIRSLHLVTAIAARTEGVSRTSVGGWFFGSAPSR